MFFKKRKKEEIVNVQPKQPELKESEKENKYSANGTFPHILVTYILIFVIGLLIFQISSTQSKMSENDLSFKQHIINDEQRIDKLEKSVKQLSESDNKQPTINNYYYGQAPSFDSDK